MLGRSLLSYSAPVSYPLERSGTQVASPAYKTTNGSKFKYTKVAFSVECRPGFMSNIFILTCAYLQFLDPQVWLKH